MSRKIHIALIVVLLIVLAGLLALVAMLSQGNGQWKLPRDEAPDGSAVIPESTGLLEEAEEVSDPAEETELAQEGTQPEPTEQPKKENGGEGEETKPGKPTEKETTPALTQPTGESTQPEEPTKASEESEETLPVEDSFTNGAIMPDDEF